MSQVALMIALLAGAEAPAGECCPWYPHYPSAKIGFRGVPPHWDGGWWYGSVAWNGCPPAYISPPWSCHPGSGLGGHWDGWDGAAGSYVPSTAPSSPTEETPATKPGKDGEARAHLILDLPPGAKLFVDNQPIQTAPGKHVLRTPSLRQGQLYYYDVRVEVVIAGQTFVRSKQLIVRPGEDLRASFSDVAWQPAAPTEATAQR